MLAPAAPNSGLLNGSNGKERGNDREAGGRISLKSKEATGNQAVNLTGSDIYALRREGILRKLPSITGAEINDKSKGIYICHKPRSRTGILDYATSHRANRETARSFSTGTCGHNVLDLRCHHRLLTVQETKRSSNHNCGRRRRQRYSIKLLER